MIAGTLSRPLTRALQSIRKQDGSSAADSFRKHLALRLHMARLLGPLTLDQVRYLVARAQLHDCRAGETVLDRKDAARYHLLLLQGEVKVQRRASGNRNATRRHVTLKPMDAMGGFALLNAVTREQCATAVSDGRILLIDADLTDALVGWNQQFGSLNRTDPALWQWVAAMRDVRLFSRIPAYRREAVIRSMDVRPVAVGDVVVRSGERVDHYYSLEAGEAGLWRCDPVTGREQCMARLGPGDAFGDEVLVPDSRHGATVRMVTAGRVRVLARADLEALTGGALQQEVSASQARAMLETGAARVLDCRCGMEVLEPRIPGALGLPLDHLRWDMHTLDRGIHYIVCCRSGLLARVAAFLLRQQHIQATPLAGGINAWPYELEWG